MGVFGQVGVSTPPVSAPPATVTAPSTFPNPASTPGSLINPAAPTAVPPQTAGRTFQTPVTSGAPSPNRVFQRMPVTGFPPATNGVFPFTRPTNFGRAVPFTTNPGLIGGDAAGAGFPAAFTNGIPAAVNPALVNPPVAVDLPPGTVLGTTRPAPVTPPNAVGTPRPSGAVGNAPAAQQGTGARPPAVVRPQR